MKWAKSSCAGILITLMLSNQVFAEACSTHQHCNMGDFCKCTVPADSSGPRIYYLDFDNVEKSNSYRCDFNGMDMKYIGANGADGIKFTCLSGDCGYFPIALEMDAKAMEDQFGSAEVSMQVSPSDMPWDVDFACKITSNK